MVLVNMQCAGDAGDASGAGEFAINKFDMDTPMQPYIASEVAVVSVVLVNSPVLLVVLVMLVMLEVLVNLS